MNRTTTRLVAVAAVVVILAAARAAQEIVLPFLLAVFISIVAAAPIAWLRNRGISVALAVTIVLILVITFLFGATLILTTSIDSFSQMLPQYQERLRETIDQLLQWLAGSGINISLTGIRSAFDPGAAMNLANNFLGSLTHLLSNAFLLILTVIFVMIEASVIPEKIKLISNDTEKTMAQINLFVENTNRYMSIKMITSLITGVLVGIGMALLGVDYPLLWGFLAFLLNFIPTIGSFIAAVPAVLIALVQLGVGMAVAVTVFYLAVNMLVGNIIEPRLLGRGVGLTTLVVFLSMVFWGWLFGPIGMLLSVPLTMVVKFAADSKEDTRWVAILLSPLPDANEPIESES
jgi:predicted PurR-regulated permease PerM